MSDPADLLDEHIRTARWFGGKGRGGTFISWVPLPWFTPDPAAGAPWPRVRSELVEVRYPGDEATEWYQLLLAYRDAADHNPLSWIGDRDDPELGPVSVHDATADPEALTLLLRAVTDGIEVRDDTASVTATSVGALSPPLVPRRFGGEQSNTSILYGDAAILKLFRRLEQGRNLDIEVHAALSGSRSAAVADFHGAVGARWDTNDGTRVGADLAVLIEQFPDARGGWEEALAACADNRDFTGESHALGAALAEVHGLLAERFPTETLTGADVASAMRFRLDTAIIEVPALDPYGPGLRRCFDALAGHDWPAQRVHGDFHLGQALLTAAGWRIIDFEGEPMKSLAERARPDSPWRDVAGMLRSFDYAGAQVRTVRRAAGASELAAPADGTDDAAAWVQCCRTAFLAGYTGDPAGAAEPGHGSRAALHAYEADKAVYEVRYESRNRPDWVAIPMAAAATLSTMEPPNTAPSEET